MNSFARISSIVMVAAAFSVATPHVAQAASYRDRIAAQKLINKGLRAERKEQWKDALEYFTEANELRSTPTSLYHMARCMEHMGRLLEAKALLQEVLDKKMGTYHQRKKVKKLMEEIQSKIPHLTIVLPPDFEGRVLLGEDMLEESKYGEPVEVDPGTHTIQVEAEGFEPYEKTVTLEESSEQTVEVDLVPSKDKSKEQDEAAASVSSDDASGRRTLGYVGVAVGGAGLVVGTVFGLAAKSTRDDLRAVCNGDVCPETHRDLYDKGKGQATLSTVGFVVGGVGLGAGIYFLATSGGGNSKKDSSKGREVSSVTVRPVIGPGSFMLQGRF